MTDDVDQQLIYELKAVLQDQGYICDAHLDPTGNRSSYRFHVRPPCGHDITVDLNAFAPRLRQHILANYDQPRVYMALVSSPR
jgi:hypothetical protein